MIRFHHSVPGFGTALGLGLTLLLAPLPLAAQQGPTSLMIQPLNNGVTVETETEESPLGTEAAATDKTETKNPATAGAAQTALSVDISALRYYIKQGQHDRVELEINRLRTLYPDWSPPADLFDPNTESAHNEDQRLWDLLATEDLEAFDRARKSFADTHPGWTASPSLTRERKLVGARLSLRRAAATGNWAEVAHIGRATPELIGCADPQSSWDIARARIETHAPRAEARNILAELIRDCKAFDIRLATLQKASHLLPWADMGALKALEAKHRRTAEQDAHLARIQTDLTRYHLSTMLSKTSGTLSSAEIAGLERMAEEAQDAKGAALLGWYFLRVKTYAKADVWFRRSLTWHYSDSAAEGLVRTRFGQGKRQAALTLIRKYEQKTPKLRLIRRDEDLQHLEDLSPDEGERLGHLVASSQDARGATQLGWHAYRQGHDTDAQSWFSRALNWGDQSAVEGLVLTYLRLGEREKAQSLVTKWSSRDPKLKAYETALAGGFLADAADAARRKDFTACLRLVKRAVQKTGASSATHTQQGWCLLELHRPAEASQAFKAALDLIPSGTECRDLDAVQQANAGILWSLLAQNMPTQVLSVIQQVELSDEDRRTLHLEAVTRRAVASYHRGDWHETLRLLAYRNQFMPRERGLMALEGWSLYHLHRLAEAKALFQTLDRQYSTPETREALDVLTGDRLQ